MKSSKLQPFVILTALALLTFSGCGYDDAPSPDNVSGVEPRVISLAPNLTEMIVALGAGEQLVGRSSACDYPATALKDIPIVGGFGEPSIEALLAQNPTLIVDVALADRSLQTRMRQAGLSRKHIPCHHLDDIPAALRTLGNLLQREQAAYDLAQAFEEDLDRLRRRSKQLPDTGRPLVFTELWAEPLMTVGRGSFISECIRLAGGRNLGDEKDTEYFYLSHEHVVARNPDVILLLYMTKNEPAERLASRIGWESINAVRQRRIYGDLDPDLIMRPGLRIMRGIDQLRQAIDNPETVTAEEYAQ